MSIERAARPVALYLSASKYGRSHHLLNRTFSSTAPALLEIEQKPSETILPPRTSVALDPNTVSTSREERRLFRGPSPDQHTKVPIGSRRRRAILSSSADNIPFEQLPYQCFQEARKVIIEDRAEKLKTIQMQRDRIERLRSSVVPPEEERQKEHRLTSMRQRLEELKIWADINDPLVKKKFEDGEGDMNKPIYRHLADKKWRASKRLIIMQRIAQMHVIPDVLSSIDPTVAVSTQFHGRILQHGEIIDSRISEDPAHLHVQPFDKGERLVTIAIVNPDVPNVEKDGFDYRCHFLACNIPISPTETAVSIPKLQRTDSARSSATTTAILPWLPAYAQKGAPYQRMAIFVFQQPRNEFVNVEVARKKVKRDGFVLKSFMDRHMLKPVGVDMFRTQWDEGTAGVMQRVGVVGWDVEFKRKKIEPLPYKKLPGSRYR